MSIFQTIYDKIKNFRSPDWYVYFMDKLQEMIWELVTQVAMENIQKIKVQIIEISKMNDLNNQQKFQLVKEFTINLLPQTKESMINLLIELLVNQLKKERVV